jgi:hypothetical protein
MNDADVFPTVLRALSVSPLWSWDAPPILWALLSEDPVIITPAIILPDLETLIPFAMHWREHLTAGEKDVPVETLALTVEGSMHFPDGREQDFRDAIVIHKDGGMSMFRHMRQSGDMVELDPTNQMLAAVEAMREVGASSWH